MKTELFEKIAKELSENYGGSFNFRIDEIKSVLKQKQEELKIGTEALGSEADAELSILMNYYANQGEHFEDGQNRKFIVDENENIELPLEIRYLFCTALKKSENSDGKYKEIIKLGDLQIPTGIVSISSVVNPYNYFIMDHKLIPGSYPLYLNYEKQMKHLGFNQLYLLRLKDNGKPSYWKQMHFRLGKYPPINGTDPNLIGIKCISEVNLFDSSILVMDFQSHLWMREKCNKGEFKKQIKIIKALNRNKEIKNKLIEIDAEHNFSIINSKLGPAVYFSYIGCNDDHEPVCLIFDMHIYFYNEPTFKVELNEFHGF